MITKLLADTNELLSANAKTRPTVIVGLSGGPDSVFLLHLLHTLREQGVLTLIAAHLNHEWRTESYNDLLFCQALCNRLNIPFFHSLARAHVHYSEKNGSAEALGRLARRRFFEQLAHDHAADFIALGHHADDQQETFFIRLLRGSSLSGLTGMKRRDGAYIRPLLAMRKQDILSYLATHNIAFLHDATNTSNAFLRNRIRNHVIPALEQTDARFHTTFHNTLTQLCETEHFLVQHTSTLFAELFGTTTPHQGSIKAFLAQPLLLQKRLLIMLLCAQNVRFNPSNNHLEEIIRYLKTPLGGTHQLHTSWHVWKKNGLFGIAEQVAPHL